MNAGTLDRRITIEQRIDTRDAFGEPIAAWTPLAVVWASLESLQGQELIETQETNAKRKARFRIRWRDDVTEKTRVAWDGEVWDINQVNEIGRRVGLELLVTAAVP